jgi:mRNA-degrading endonuclease HigB of HigAB toxin-antitoxin module
MTNIFSIFGNLFKCLFPRLELWYSYAMLLVNKELLAKFLRESTGAITAISLWVDDIQRYQWSSRQDVLKAYPQTKFVAGSMAVFSFEAGRFSVTTQIAFNTAVVIVLAVAVNVNLNQERQ